MIKPIDGVTWLDVALCVALFAAAWRLMLLELRQRRPKQPEPEPKTVHPEVKVNDQQKRRTLQPGVLAEASERLNSQAPTPLEPLHERRLRDVLKVRTRDTVGVVHEHVVAPTALVTPEAVAITEDATKRRSLQPHGDEKAILESRAALAHRAFEHKFFGSQLIVGSAVLARGLSVGMHVAEITADNLLFIDNNPYPANPSDLVRVKEELAKLK